MKRTLLIAAGLVVLVAGGVVAYRQFGPRPAQPQRGDPAIAVAGSLRILERSPQHQLTQAQITTILPLLKVLRDTPATDVEASRALAEQIRAALTPEQLAELNRFREEARRRRQSAEAGRPGSARPGGGQGFGGLGGGRQGGRQSALAEFRQQMLTRLIQQLESRI